MKEKRNKSARLRRSPHLVGLFVGILGVLFGGATAYAGPNVDGSIASAATVESDATDSEINASLDALAKLFASTIDDQAFRESIHDTVADRFDGDTDVLWTKLAAEPSVRSALATNLSLERSVTTGNALKQIDLLATQIPRFQVAVPKKFDRWDPATYTPLVGYMPEGVDDTTLKTITAYDASGGAHLLDAQVAPDQPVIILGVNERTDDSGALLEGTDSPEISGIPGEKGSVAAGHLTMPAAAAATSYLVELNEIRVWNVHEPWSKGDAEFSFVAKSNGCSLYHLAPNVSGIDEDGDRRRWSGDGLDLGHSSCTVIMSFWEDDGGNYDFGLMYSGVSLGVHMDDSDDLMGGHAFAASYFAGDTEQWYTGLDDLEFSME